MIRKISFLISLGAAFIFGYLYYVQYFKWRDCFNEEGRCFDDQSGVVYSEQSGAIWLSLTVLALGVSLYAGRKLRRQKQQT